MTVRRYGCLPGLYEPDDRKISEQLDLLARIAPVEMIGLWFTLFDNRLMLAASSAELMASGPRKYPVWIAS